MIFEKEKEGTGISMEQYIAFANGYIKCNVVADGETVDVLSKNNDYVILKTKRKHLIFVREDKGKSDEYMLLFSHDIVSDVLSNKNAYDNIHVTVIESALKVIDKRIDDVQDSYIFYNCVILRDINVDNLDFWHIDIMDEIETAVNIKCCFK